jgi:hypothetical protein
MMKRSNEQILTCERDESEAEPRACMRKNRQPEYAATKGKMRQNPEP